MTTALAKTYGELRWVDDMDPMAAETSSDYESLTQDVFHVIKETLGSNLDDETRGIGAENYLGGTSAGLAAMPAQIDAQLLDDPRITSSQSSLAQQSDGTWLVQVALVVAGSVLSLNFQLGPSGLTVA